MSHRAAEPDSLDAYLASSPRLRTVLAGIRRAAATDAPILLLGESGTGRSALARALHRVSRRRAAALVEVDPGTIPGTLFESELFGYRRGAFTGAEQSMHGRVAQAEGGTLVLDHVEALPLSVQPKLLRLLAESRFAPLGGSERPADVRFVALGVEDLPVRVERGAFRADLYYRLDVLAFHLPALRRRLDDVPTLASVVLADLAGRLGRPVPTLTARALDWMIQDAWPGNLRELRNVLERALVAAVPGAEEIDPPPPRRVAGRRPRTLLDVERRAILEALAWARGHQGKAAEALGISRKALWAKRKRLGIP